MQKTLHQTPCNFIAHGLLGISTETIKAFKTEYNVGFISENCMMDPISFKVAMRTNEKNDACLTTRFENDWKNKLPAQTFGL